MRVRTYGVTKETLNNLTNHVFTDFCMRVANNPDVGGSQETYEAMVDHPDLCKMLIMATAVFAVGNFDRIDKLERWAEVDETGKIDNDTLEEFDPDFVV